MPASLVLTILGPDRTGIVGSLASTVSQHGGSWEESQMARLAGQFAGIVQVTCSEEVAAALTADLKNLESDGLQISIAQQEIPSLDSPRIQMQLDVLGNDRPGILAEVSQALRTQNANIVDISTRVEPAPESGQPIFHTIAVIAIDHQADPDELSGALEALSPDLQVSLTT